MAGKRCTGSAIGIVVANNQYFLTRTNSVSQHGYCGIKVPHEARGRQILKLQCQFLRAGNTPARQYATHQRMLV